MAIAGSGSMSRTGAGRGLEDDQDRGRRRRRGRARALVGTGTVRDAQPQVFGARHSGELTGVTGRARLITDNFRLAVQTCGRRLTNMWRGICKPAAYVYEKAHDIAICYFAPAGSYQWCGQR
jgi:hypothetical protein